jgi:hypothetical protein
VTEAFEVEGLDVVEVFTSEVEVVMGLARTVAKKEKAMKRL